VHDIMNGSDLGQSYLPRFCFGKYSNIPWIPEPSTVNNKLKRHEGSGIQGNSNIDIHPIIIVYF
jgi:hypothetical protein